MGGTANGNSSAGYASAYPDYVPDARQRGRVSIAHVLPASREAAARRRGVPADLVFTSILAKSLLALSLHLVKEWLLGANSASPIFHIHFWLLLVGSLASAVWSRPWEAVRDRIKVQMPSILIAQLVGFTTLNAIHPPIDQIPQLALYGLITCLESMSLLRALDKLPVLR